MVLKKLEVDTVSSVDALGAHREFSPSLGINVWFGVITARGATAGECKPFLKAGADSFVSHWSLFTACNGSVIAV